MTESSLQRLFDLQRGAEQPSYEGETEQLKKSAALYIKSIPNAEIRSSMYERYINALSWDKIADRFCCGTADAVRKRCKRFIKAAAKAT